MAALLTADNGIIGHQLKVLSSQDISAASGGNKDLSLASCLLHGDDLETGDSGLESVDGVNFCNQDASTHSMKSHSTTLSDITETSNNGNLPSDHDIGGTLDTIDQRLAAAVQVVELGLGDGVVDVDRWNKEGLILQHLVQVVDTSGGLLRDTVAALQHLWVFLVNESSKVSTIIKNQVQALATLEGNKLLLQAPLVFLLCLALPCENRYTWEYVSDAFEAELKFLHTSSGDSSRGVVLC